MKREERHVPISGFEANYLVYDSGKVYSIRSKKFLKPSKTGKKRNYLSVVLSVNKSKCTRKIHRLVAQHFVSNPCGKPEVNHDNGDTFCNYHWNLKWATTKENVIHSWGKGLNKVSNEQRKRFIEMSKNQQPPTARKVRMIDVKNLKEKTFDSIMSASRSAGVSNTAISNALAGRSKKAGGFVWKYS